jgi:Ca2+-binding RTX toxin-like protein
VARLIAGRGAVVCAVLAGLLAVAPLGAKAATVDVTTEAGTPSKATLRFLSGPGESNQVTVTVNGSDTTNLQVVLHDPAVAIAAGAGCSGGGAPGADVTCLLPKPRPVEYTQCGRICALPIDGTGWTTSIVATLGDGDNAFDASKLPGLDQDAIDVTVTAGNGDDTIATADGEDQVEAAAGKDQIHTGGRSDEIVASVAPDGPDLYDLGSGYDVIDYSQRTQPVLYTALGEGDDGAPGEGDTVLGATAVLSGSGDDVLSGGPGTDRFVAGGGNDRLSGGDGDDDLNGEGGENLLIGEEGSDRIVVERLSPPQAGGTVVAPNRAEGGPGDDYMYMAAGPDIALGGDGDDVVKMGDGDDVAAGGPGADQIYGDRGDDLLAGEDDGDALVGDEGSDRLLGGPGDDRLVAGVIADRVPSDPFLAKGQFDGWRDRVACGTGSDRALANPWDVVVGCERTALVRAVDFGRLLDGRGGGHLLPIKVRGPGRLLLTGAGIAKQVRIVTESRFGRPYFRWKRKTVTMPLVLSAAAKRALHQRGRLRLRVEVRFFPRKGVPRAARESFLLRG